MDLDTPITAHLGLGADSDAPAGLRHHRIPSHGLWCFGVNASELPFNPYADALLRRLDPDLGRWDWRGPIALRRQVDDAESGLQPLPPWLRAVLEHSNRRLVDGEDGIDAQPGDVDPIRLSALLATHGWTHIGVVVGTDDLLYWTRFDLRGARICYSVAHDPVSDTGRTQALAELARYERREPRDLRADLAAVAISPTGHSGVRRSGLAEREQRLRADFEIYDHLRRSAHARDKYDAERLEIRWLHTFAEHSVTWVDLETTIAAWRARPQQMSALYSVLLTYPDCVAPILIRSHEQARALTDPFSLFSTTPAQPSLTAAAAAAPTPSSIRPTLVEPVTPTPEVDTTPGSESCPAP